MRHKAGPRRHVSACARTCALSTQCTGTDYAQAMTETSAARASSCSMFAGACLLLQHTPRRSTEVAVLLALLRLKLGVLFDCARLPASHPLQPPIPHQHHANASGPAARHQRPLLFCHQQPAAQDRDPQHCQQPGWEQVAAHSHPLHA